MKAKKKKKMRTTTVTCYVRHHDSVLWKGPKQKCHDHDRKRVQGQRRENQRLNQVHASVSQHGDGSKGSTNNTNSHTPDTADAELGGSTSSVGGSAGRSSARRSCSASRDGLGSTGGSDSGGGRRGYAGGHRDGRSGLAGVDGSRTEGRARGRSWSLGSVGHGGDGAERLWGLCKGGDDTIGSSVDTRAAIDSTR